MRKSWKNNPCQSPLTAYQSKLKPRAEAPTSSPPSFAMSQRQTTSSFPSILISVIKVAFRKFSRHTTFSTILWRGKARRTTDKTITKTWTYPFNYPWETPSFQRCQRWECATTTSTYKKPETTTSQSNHKCIGLTRSSLGST